MTSSARELRLLEWDTAFFGRRIALLVTPPGERIDLTAIVDSARHQQIECVYALSEESDHATIRALNALGARLVDMRLTFERALTPSEAPIELEIRHARPEDVPALRALAGSSHGTSRFYVDGRFPRARCDEMFAQWIENSCNGWANVVRVALFDGRVAGYATGHARENARGEIGLVAVDPRAQGHGLGSRLVSTMLGDLNGLGVAKATVVTQGRNTTAQRLYQNRGFRPSRVQTWHHMWLDELQR